MSDAAGVVVKAGDLATQSTLWGDAWRQLRRSPLFLVAAFFVIFIAVMAAVPAMLTSIDPRACPIGDSLIRPGSEHWFGTDLLGCDYYARVVHGARVSLIVGSSVVAIDVVIAIFLGSIAGYYGGWIDGLLSRVTDVWFGVPAILGAIVLLSVLGGRGMPQVILVLALFGWPSMMRLMRANVLGIRELEYVQAARAIGVSGPRILIRHILPNAITPVIVYGTIFIGIVIAAEATLSFLGIGLQLPAISWGLMISKAQHRIQQAPHLLLFPGVFLSVTVFSFIIMGDALRDALDPKLR